MNQPEPTQVDFSEEEFDLHEDAVGVEPAEVPDQAPDQSQSQDPDAEGSA